MTGMKLLVLQNTIIEINIKQMENYKNKLNEVIIIESSIETYFIYAIRNAINVSKHAYPTAKKVLFRRDGVEVEISEVETEQSLYDKFRKKQKEHVWNSMKDSVRY